MKTPILKLQKKKVFVKNLHDPTGDTGYVPGSKKQRLLMMWELTKEVWFLKKTKHAQRRLQRHIVNIIKK